MVFTPSVEFTFRFSPKYIVFTLYNLFLLPKEA